MKFMTFVDTHGDEIFLEELTKYSKDVDLYVCAGDFTVFERDIEKILKKFNSFGKPVLIIHGNHESSSTIIEVANNMKNIYFIHKTYFLFKNFVFFGYGGGGFTKTDDKFDEAARKLLDDLKKTSNENKKIILVTHAPPHDTKLDDLGEHVGCKNFKKFILEKKPVIAISGHLHENEGTEDVVGKTLVINPGPWGRLIEIDD